MHVKTDLKAGSPGQSLQQQAASFYTKANQQAKDLSTGTARITSSLYGCVTKSFASI
jgi:hypothetical protein